VLLLGRIDLAAADRVGSEPTRAEGKTADYAAWIQDMEDRKARSAALEAKRQAHKPQEPKVEASAIDEVLNNLDAAAEDFELTQLKPNLPLIEMRNEVERLRSELSAAETKLAEIEARGDSIQRLTKRRVAITSANK